MARRALVTGGGRSIGAAISKTLAEEGYSVAVVTRDAAAAEAFAATLPGEGHVGIGGDIAVPEETTRIVADAVAALGGVDVLVNNAGTYLDSDVSEVDFAEWQHAWTTIMGTNVFGTANMSYAFVQHLLSRPEGAQGARIVNIGSRGGYRGEPTAPAYGASKAAIHSMTQSLASSLAKHGVGVAGVAPGFITTDSTREKLATEAGALIKAQSPFGRAGEPEEIASAVKWLASAESIWSTGTIIDANGASYFR